MMGRPLDESSFLPAKGLPAFLQVDSLSFHLVQKSLVTLLQRFASVLPRKRDPWFSGIFAWKSLRRVSTVENALVD